MPLTPPGIVGALAPNLIASGLPGISTPQLAAGVANGVSQWIPLVVVQTVDVGVAGAGTGTLPLVVTSPSLLGALFAGFAGSGLVGMSVPLMVNGLTNGLVLAFSQGLIQTVHAGVGVGSGVATFRGPPATPLMIAGLKSAGMIGDSAERLANAIGVGLDTTFASLVLPIPIVGAGSPTPSSGSGIGKII